MWGANGKNHFGAMGHCWLVACLLLPSTVVAWSDSDSENLASLDDSARLIRGDVHNIWIDMHSFSSLFQSIGNSVDVCASNGNAILKWLNGLERINDEEADTSYDGKGVRVVSKGINSRLDRIIELLSNQNSNQNSSASFFIPLDANFFYGSNITSSQVLNQMDAYLRLMYAYYDSLLSGAPSSELLDQYYDILLRYGTWKWEAMSTLFAINPQYLYGASSDTNVFGRVWQSYLDDFGIANSVRFLRAYNESYFHQYSTLPLYLLQSNYLYSAVQNGQTNNSIISQLISSGETSALFGNGDMSNSLSSVSSLLSQNGLVSTNDSYLGQYSSPSNASQLVDITPNDWVNSDYSAYQDQFDQQELEEKFQDFDINTFFSDSLDQVISDINVNDVGDFVLEFGNLSLGDWFSFTIPSITISRNETYLDFVDKFLFGLKAFATCCFFLVLWRQLSEVT